MMILTAIVVYLIVVILLKLWNARHHNEENHYVADENEISKEKSAENDFKASKEESSSDAEKKPQMVSADIIIPLARKAKTELEAEYVLSQNWSDEIQIALARTSVFECQKILLNSPKLSGEGLTTICEIPSNFNFDNDIVISWFNNAIQNTKLTANQEERIARCGEFTVKVALLKRTKLTGEGLVILCQNTGNINVDDSSTVYEWFEKAIERTKLTAYQELEIAKTEKIAIIRALLLRSKINGTTMVQLCEKTGNLNLDSQTVWGMYEKAIRNCKLTPEEEVSMVRSNNFPAQRGLILKKDISYEAFLELCRKPNQFNMDHPLTNEYFRNAAKCLAPKLTDVQKTELAKSRIESVIKGLM